MTLELKASCDRKTKFHKHQKNTLGLLPGPVASGGTCPGCTKKEGGCWFIPAGKKVADCYAARLELAYKGVHALLEHNTRLLMTASPNEKFELLKAEFDRFYASELNRSAKTGEMHSIYRLHWSGDVFNNEYANALVEAMQHFDRRLKFWTYTRSFWAVRKLLETPNLMLWLSLDKVNMAEGLHTYKEVYEDLTDEVRARFRIAYMSRENPGMLGSSNCKVSPCPVDNGTLPLEYGCATCMRCFTPTTPHVWFKV